jgi:hypothetical protein
MSALRLQSEPTEAGEQCLVPGVRPIPLRERLERMMEGPLAPVRAQKPLNIGLFDEDALNQLEMFGPGGRIVPFSHQLPPRGG